MAGDWPTTKYIQSADQIKKSRKIASPQIKAHIFQSFPNGRARTIWFSNQNFYGFSMEMVSTPGDFIMKWTYLRRPMDLCLQGRH